MADFPPVKNGAHTFYTSLVSQANPNIMQANPTLAAGDVKVATDDGAPGNIATLPTVDADFTKRIKVELSAAEMNGDRVTIIFSDAAGAEWCDMTIDLATVTRQLLNLAFPTTSGRSIDVTATGAVGIDWANVEAPTTVVGLSGTTIKTATDVETDTAEIGVAGAGLTNINLPNQTMDIVGNITGNLSGSVGSVGAGGIANTSFAAGAIDAAAVAANALGTSEIASTVDARISDAVWDEAKSGHTTQGTYGENQNAVISGNAIAGTLSTTQMSTDLTEATDDHFNGRTLIWTSGVLLGQATNITDYTGATKVLTYTAITEAPSAGDDFLIV